MKQMETGNSKKKIFPYQAWVFDLDGTILDSANDIARAVNIVRQQHHLPILPLRVIQEHIGRGVRYLMEKSIPECTVDVLILIEEFKEAYSAHLVEETTVYPGAMELLHLLKKRKKQIFLLSNKPELFCRKLLAHFEIDTLFTEIFGGDTFAQRKPEPDGLLHIMNQHKFKAEDIVMVGDTHMDGQAAEKAGTHFLLVHNPDIAQLYPTSFETIYDLFTAAESME